VLSETTKPDAREVAERTRLSVEEHIEDIAGIKLKRRPTISVGIATYPADADDANSLVRTADQALYTAKSNGRNQVRVHGDMTRSFRRADMKLVGRFRTLENSYEDFATTSVGQGGFSMDLDRELTAGSLIEVALRIPERGRDLVATGRVVYVRPTSSGEFETGVNITEIAESDRATLGKVLEEIGSVPAANA